MSAALIMQTNTLTKIPFPQRNEMGVDFIGGFMGKYHTIIIGAGPAGYTAALKLAEAGKSVCLIDKSKEHVGGTCLNRGCIPTKSILESANLYKRIQEAKTFGIDASSKNPNLETILEKANNNVSLLKKGLLSLLKNKKVNLEFGTASFLSPEKIVIKNKDQSKEIEAENFILATGSKPKELPGFEIDNEKIFNSNRLFKKLPEANNLLIIGGGYIGCEFAQFYNALGAKVTIVDIAESLLPGQDKDVVKILEREFSKKGIKILTAHKTTVTDLEQFDAAIIVVGREPNLDSLNLANIGIKLEKKFIKVDKNFRTTVTNIYAIGDLINTPMLAHVAFAEGEKSADYILGEEPKPIDYKLVPEVIFAEPQIASIGLKECEAKKKGIEIEVKKKFFRAVAKARILGEVSGFAKLIANKNSQKLIGASIIGPQATELIHILSGWIKNSSSIQEVEEAIYAHPTLSEIFAP
jgi:dihydrolipoamide dehydrogenase